MVEVLDNVKELVQQELQKNSNATTQDLYRMAVELEPDIGKLESRQFFARYILPVKRQMGQGDASKSGESSRNANSAGASATKRRSARRGRSARAAAMVRDDRHVYLRQELLELVQAAAEAKTSSDLIQLVAGIDDRVNAILEHLS